MSDVPSSICKRPILVVNLIVTTQQMTYTATQHLRMEGIPSRKAIDKALERAGERLMQQIVLAEQGEGE